MMADLINLRTARKNKQRVEAEKLAEDNRVKFGRSKGEKKKTTSLNVLANKKLDGKKFES